MMNRIVLLDFVVAFHNEHKVLLQDIHYMEEVEVHYLAVENMMSVDKFLVEESIHFLDYRNVRSQ